MWDPDFNPSRKPTKPSSKIADELSPKTPVFRSTTSSSTRTSTSSKLPTTSSDSDSFDSDSSNEDRYSSGAPQRSNLSVYAGSGHKLQSQDRHRSLHLGSRLQKPALLRPKVQVLALLERELLALQEKELQVWLP